MRLFSGLANAVAVLSGDTLCSISGPSGDPAAGVIEQTSGPVSVCPSNETQKATANKNIQRVRALDQRQAAWNRVSDFRGGFLRTWMDGSDERTTPLWLFTKPMYRSVC